MMRKSLPAVTLSSSAPQQTASSHRPVSLSLTSALLSTTTWASAVQLLVFASSKHLKLQPETLLIAHHRIHQSIAQRPCALAVALLTHLHETASLPYRMTRSACAVEARKPPATLFLDHLTSSCQRGHWMDGLRLLERCSAIVMRAPARSHATPRTAAESLITVRDILSPPSIALDIATSTTHDASSRVITQRSSIGSPYACWYGVALLLDNALLCWGRPPRAQAAAAPRAVDALLPRRLDVAKELLWFASHVGAISELRQHHVAICFFRLAHEIIVDQAQCGLADCRDLITSSLRAASRLAAAGHPLASSSAFYTFRACAQRAALRAMQLTPTVADAVHVLDVLFSSPFVKTADEEVLIAALQQHPLMGYDAVRLARDPTSHYVSDATLKACVSRLAQQDKDDGSRASLVCSRAVDVVAAQWRYRWNTTAHGSPTSGDVSAIMDVQFVLPTLHDRAEWLVHIAGATQEQQQQHPSVMQDVISQHGLCVVKSLKSLVSIGSPGNDGRQPLFNAQLSTLCSALPVHLLSLLCDEMIRLVESPTPPPILQTSDPTTAHPSPDHPHLTTTMTIDAQERLISLFCSVQLKRGLHPSFLLRFIPRALECLTASELSSSSERRLPQHHRQLVVDLLEACVRGAAYHGQEVEPLYEVVVPMVLHFLVTVVGRSWLDATRRLNLVAAPWLRGKHYFSALTITPHLLSSAGSRPNQAISRATSPAWEIALQAIEAQRQRADARTPTELHRLLVHAMPLLSQPAHVEEVKRVVVAANDFWTFQTLLLLATAPLSPTTSRAPLSVRCRVAKDVIQHHMATQDAAAVEAITASLNSCVDEGITSEGHGDHTNRSCVSDVAAAAVDWAAACRELVARFPSQASKLRQHPTSDAANKLGRNLSESVLLLS